MSGVGSPPTRPSTEPPSPPSSCRPSGYDQINRQPLHPVVDSLESGPFGPYRDDPLRLRDGRVQPRSLSAPLSSTTRSDHPEDPGREEGVPDSRTPPPRPVPGEPSERPSARVRDTNRPLHVPLRPRKGRAPRVDPRTDSEWSGLLDSPGATGGEAPLVGTRLPSSLVTGVMSGGLGGPVGFEPGWGGRGRDVPLYCRPCGHRASSLAEGSRRRGPAPTPAYSSA